MRPYPSTPAGAVCGKTALSWRRWTAGLGVALACFSAAHSGASPEPVEEALPLVGSGGHGHTYPGATAPFGMVQLSPDTRTEGWDACSGYHYADSSLLGFSHTHLSGTGCADLADLLVLPLTGPLQEGSAYAPLQARRFQTAFSHARELAQPGYYRVRLDRYNILAELTATAHAGMHRYTFPAAEQGHILLDLVHGIGNRSVESCLKIESLTLVTGYRRSDGWAKGKTVYFAIECAQPFDSFGLEVGGKPLAAARHEAVGPEVRGHLDYRTTAGQPVVLRVGLSPTSVEAARKNLLAEVDTWDFDAVRKAAQAAWNEQLGRIRIESSNPNTRQTFYSALYHTMSAPTLYNDADGAYRGPDGKTHAAEGFNYYSTFSLWDTFRAEHPLLTLLQPERIDDFVRSLLAFYQQSPEHLLPMWPLCSSETHCMIGYHSAPVIWDAYAKGFRGFDAELAWQAMRATALHSHNRQDEYQKLGYVPWIQGRSEATSRTLEFAFDDWCLAQMARALGKTQDALLFGARAQSFTNVWDAKSRFFRSRKPDGSYQEPFNPKEVATGPVAASGYYTEANAWQYTFSVFHDIPGLTALYGGRQALIQRLDEFFNEDSDMSSWRIDVTGLLGQYAHGNEPCHHVAYLYAVAGAPAKTARRVREIQLTQYDNTPEGICGNDDCGQMSAWYVFSALGLYPLNPANGIYVIGSPLVEKATLRLHPRFSKGGAFTVVAHNVSRQNLYVQAARLNGRPLLRPWITHEDIVKGGSLELDMDILPGKSWGAMAGE